MIVRVSRAIWAAASVALVAWFVPRLIFFLETDDCLDSGGHVNSAGVCVVEMGAHYAPLFSPLTPLVVWFVLFGMISLVIVAIYKFGLWLAEMVFSSVHSDKPTT